MATSPLPREPLTGTCDASGNATLLYRGPTAFWAHCYVAIQVSAGTPTYALTLGGSGSPLVFGQGNQAQLGPALLQPGERMSIVVTGATAGATILGQVLGWQAANPDDLIPLLPIQPTAVTIANTLSGAIPTINPPWVLNGSSAGGGATKVTTITIPPGTMRARFVVSSNGGAAYTAALAGVQTGTVYATSTVNFGALTRTSVVFAGDTQLTITETPGLGNGGTWNLEFTFSSSVLPQEAVQTATFAIAIAATTTLDLVGALAGTTIYCLRWQFDVLTAAVAEIDLEDDAGLILARSRTDVTGTRYRDLQGVPATPSQKVRMHNTAGIQSGSIVGELVFVQR